MLPGGWPGLAKLPSLPTVPRQAPAEHSLVCLLSRGLASAQTFFLDRLPTPATPTWLFDRYDDPMVLTEQSCEKLASGAVPSCSTRLVLREVLDAYFRDAERGVCDTGRY